MTWGSNAEPGEVAPPDRVAAFFEELPAAVVAYSFAVGAVAVAAILVRIAVNVYFGV